MNLKAAYISPHPPIIVEAIGQGEERLAQATREGLEEISYQIRQQKPQVIVFISPHGPLFSDAISVGYGETMAGDFGKFGHSELSWQYPIAKQMIDLVIERSQVPVVRIDSMAAADYRLEHRLDHGILVPLDFISRQYQDFQIVPITYGLLSPLELYQFGCALAGVIEEQEQSVVVVASGDLSHRLSDTGPYAYHPSGEIFDRNIFALLEQEDYLGILKFDQTLAEQAGECGLRSFMILAGLVSNYQTKTTIHSYEGPFGVGYLTASIELLRRQPADWQAAIEANSRVDRRLESAYVKLARQSLAYYLKYHRPMDLPANLTAEFYDQQRPVFVSIKKNGSLRGCIGATVSTQSNLGKEIIYYAIQAGCKDPRFPTVSEQELPYLSYSVDVLFPLEPVQSLQELDPKVYGVVVTKDYRRGLLLPNLEGVDTVEEQLRIACQKAGIVGSDYTIEKFKVVRYK